MPILYMFMAGVVAMVAAAFTYDPFMRVVWAVAFPAEIATEQQGIVYGFGLSFPYAHFLSLPAFLCLFLFLAYVIFAGAKPLLRDVAAGALAWSTPGIVLALNSLISPPPLNGALMSRAALFLLGFILFQASIGAAAGLLVYLLGRLPSTSHSGQPPAGQSRDM